MARFSNSVKHPTIPIRQIERFSRFPDNERVEEKELGILPRHAETVISGISRDARRVWDIFVSRLVIGIFSSSSSFCTGIRVTGFVRKGSSGFHVARFEKHLPHGSSCYEAAREGLFSRS